MRPPLLPFCIYHRDLTNVWLVGCPGARMQWSIGVARTPLVLRLILILTYLHSASSSSVCSSNSALQEQTTVTGHHNIGLSSRVA